MSRLVLADADTIFIYIACQLQGAHNAIYSNNDRIAFERKTASQKHGSPTTPNSED